jgi:hypothetical protein
LGRVPNWATTTPTTLPDMSRRAPPLLPGCTGRHLKEAAWGFLIAREFELVICNAQTATMLGLTVPPQLLAIVSSEEARLHHGVKAPNRANVLYTAYTAHPEL